MEFTDYDLSSSPLSPDFYGLQQDLQSLGTISRGGLGSSLGMGTYPHDSAHLTWGNNVARSPMFRNPSPNDSASLLHGDGLQSMERLNHNYNGNGVILPQESNVEIDHLIGNVSPTLDAMTSVFTDAIFPVTSPNEGSAAGVNGKRSLTCSICYRSFARRSRAEGCENMHQNKRPYACGSACGTSNCGASFPSQAGLSRHSRAVETRNRACRRCGKAILRQNIARHERKCFALA